MNTKLRVKVKIATPLKIVLGAMSIALHDIDVGLGRIMYAFIPSLLGATFMSAGIYATVVFPICFPSRRTGISTVLLIQLNRVITVKILSPNDALRFAGAAIAVFIKLDLNWLGNPAILYGSISVFWELVNVSRGGIVDYKTPICFSITAYTLTCVAWSVYGSFSRLIMDVL